MASFETAGRAADEAPPLASIVGELKQQPVRLEGINEFSVASPYQSKHRAVRSGGVLYLSEEEFRNATITTLEGNNYFIITIETPSLTILVQDEALGYP